MTWCRAVALLLLLATGCASTRVVRLETRPGEPLEYTPTSWDEQVEVGDDAFAQAVTRLLLEVPLSVRPSAVGQRVLAVSAGEALDDSYRHALRRDYGRWCETRESLSDCLSLLEDGLGFDKVDRLKVAVAFAIEPAWKGVAEELGDTLQPELLHAMVVAGLTSYVALLAFPEPAVSKTGAVLLTAWMVAYLGTGPFLVLTRACFALKQATDSATTFTELEAAGAHFGRALGRNGTRIAVMLVAAALGGGLAARGPTLPGFPLARRLAEAQVGFRLLAAGGVRSFAVAEGSLVVGLAPNALAMAVRGLQGEGTPPQKTRVSGQELAKLRREFEAIKSRFWKHEATVNPGAYSPENLAKMKNGRAPIGPDGHPLELHHKVPLAEGGTNAFDNLKILTRTEHRLGPNYKQNHPNLP
jgi:hypothetical protein